MVLKLAKNKIIIKSKYISLPWPNQYSQYQKYLELALKIFRCKSNYLFDLKKLQITTLVFQIKNYINKIPIYASYSYGTLTYPLSILARDVSWYYLRPKNDFYFNMARFALLWIKNQKHLHILIRYGSRFPFYDGLRFFATARPHGYGDKFGRTTVVWFINVSALQLFSHFFIHNLLLWTNAL